MIIIIFLLIAFILKRNTISDKNKEDIYEKKNNYKTNPDNFYSSESFEFEVNDVFSITGRGTVVTGLIKSGVIKKGDNILFYLIKIK